MLWAAKGGRGRKKPAPSQALHFLGLDKKKRGRPRVHPVKEKAIPRDNKRCSWAYSIDREIIADLIILAPANPNIPIQTLVRAEVIKRDWGCLRGTMTSEKQNVQRIMRKIRKSLPLLYYPHLLYKDKFTHV